MSDGYGRSPFYAVPRGSYWGNEGWDGAGPSGGYRNDRGFEGGYDGGRQGWGQYSPAVAQEGSFSAYDGGRQFGRGYGRGWRGSYDASDEGRSYGRGFVRGRRGGRGSRGFGGRFSRGRGNWNRNATKVLQVDKKHKRDNRKERQMKSIMKRLLEEEIEENYEEGMKKKMKLGFETRIEVDLDPARRKEIRSLLKLICGITIEEDDDLGEVEVKEDPAKEDKCEQGVENKKEGDESGTEVIEGQKSNSKVKREEGENEPEKNLQNKKGQECDREQQITGTLSSKGKSDRQRTTKVIKNTLKRFESENDKEDSENEDSENDKEASENEVELTEEIREEFEKETGLGLTENTREDYEKDDDIEITERKAATSPVPKYNHENDAEYMNRFLESVMGNIETNVERSLQTGPVLVRDPALDESFKEELESKKESEHYRNMVEFRSKLPLHEKRQEVIELVEKERVVVISGELGCGKTTQVAQYIVDDFIMKGKGSLCSVICTQTNDVSVKSVARRVADERDERCGDGSSTGYGTHQGKMLPRERGSILFCTPKVLLQWLQTNATLNNVSHLILDQLHERDTMTDFIMTILKDISPKRPDLKLILNSSTVNAEQISKYFGDVPVLNIPSSTFPVREYYLEDILHLTNFEYSKYNPKLSKKMKMQKQNEMTLRKVLDFEAFVEPHVRDLARTSQYSKSVLKNLRNPESEGMNMELMVELLDHICRKEEEGAILVFLTTMNNIWHLTRLMKQSQFFPPSRYLVATLHAKMVTLARGAVYKKPPKGVRKIVLATDDANTSVPIDDVVYVIDGGRIKMNNFDADGNLSSMDFEWESLADAAQRRVRAGRSKPGICYHLFSLARKASLREFTLPEMLRTRLDEVILQIKILQLGKVEPFLAKVMSPPDTKVIETSLQLLRRLNALDEDENLTPLGYHLAKMPLHPQISKMILMGAMFSCLDPILIIASCLSMKESVIMPHGTRASLNRQQLALGTKSDHIMLAEAYKQWEEAAIRGEAKDFCFEYGLHRNPLMLIRNLKKQLAQYLYDINLLNGNSPKAPDANINSKNISLLKAIVCSGLYPNVAQVQGVLYKGRFVADVVTPEDGRVSLHPRSINRLEVKFKSPFLLYFMKSTQDAAEMQLHDTSMIYPLPLLFFGERIKSSIDENGDERVAINDNIRLWCPQSISNIVNVLRERFHSLMAYKVSHPGVTDWTQSNEEGAILRAIIQLISYEDLKLSIPS